MSAMFTEQLIAYSTSPPSPRPPSACRRRSRQAFFKRAALRYSNWLAEGFSCDRDRFLSSVPTCRSEFSGTPLAGQKDFIKHEEGQQGEHSGSRNPAIFCRGSHFPFPIRTVLVFPHRPPPKKQNKTKNRLTLSLS